MMVDARQALHRQLGERARNARASLSLTQADVAEDIGIAVEVYGRMERGLTLPSLPTFVRLTEVLKVTPNDLLGIGDVEDQEPAPTPLRRIHRLLERVDPGVLPSLAVILKAMSSKKKTGKTGRG